MYRFVINPVARSGKGETIWNRLEKVLKAREVEYEAYFTEKRGDMIRIARELQKKSAGDPIISVGGDGTLGDLLTGVDLSLGPVLGLIPAGSGNDFNRGMGFKRDPLDALERILGCKEYRVLDGGQTEYDYVTEDGRTEHGSRRFVVSSGVGYDAETCLRLNKSKVKVVFNKLGIGKIGYLAIGFKTFFVFRRTKGTLYFDDESGIRLPRLLGFLSAHCLPFEGGGYPFARLASNTDGELTACVAAPKSRFHFLWAFLLSKSFKDFHTRFDGVYNKNFRKLRVELDEPIVLHTDGEDFDNVKQVTFSTLPKAFKYIG